MSGTKNLSSLLDLEFLVLRVCKVVEHESNDGKVYIMTSAFMDAVAEACE